MEGTLASDLQERLYMAARDGLNNIRALVRAGADVVKYAAEGLIALHYAAYCGNVETVRVILELGANAHARSVASGRHTEPSRVLVELQGAYTLTPLDMAAGGGYKRIVMPLLVNKMGGDALAQEAYGHDITP
jgi:ankyrin repeat protein